MLSARLQRADRLLKDLEAEQAATELVDPVCFDWFGTSCPCGIEPGQCVVHHRARDDQRPPAGDWRRWLIQAGRGFGKTRTGAELVRHYVATGQAKRIAIVAPTAADVRDVMLEGESGLLTISPPWDKPRYEPSKRRLSWRNGAIAHTFSADEPERLRGPQFALAWADEVGSWRKPKSWDNLLFGLRLGVNPRVVVTFTPRRTKLVRSLDAAPGTVKTGGSTHRNRQHLAPQFIQEVVGIYEGTNLGRQEIYGEMCESGEGAWFPRVERARNVTPTAEFQWGLPIHLAIDCGTSLHTAAVWFHLQRLGGYRVRIDVFGDYYSEGSFSAANAEAILSRSLALCGGRPPDLVRLDPASSARSSLGPAAYGEYERIFGTRVLACWPHHSVADGLDMLDVMIGSKERDPELFIHPRCEHLIQAFFDYSHAIRNGMSMDYPEDPAHPEEDLLDSIRGGLVDVFPDGRRPESNLHWTRTAGGRLR